MSDLFYRTVRGMGRPIMWATSRVTVLHADRVPKAGGFILASNHTCPFDVPVLIRHVPRLIDFVSITEAFKHPLGAWFYGSMNAFPHDRWKPDSSTVRWVLNRLSRGRVVAMFPEGGFRSVEKGVLSGGPMRSGVGRLANLANVPIVPVAVLGSTAYWTARAWAPTKQTRYTVAFGSPLLPAKLDAGELESRLKDAYLTLYAQILGVPRAGGSNSIDVDAPEICPATDV